ncbi:MAG: recombinase family protein [Proteobacteria bacterium]|nr:recombinase family protein [Pseudomonadota bacterium]
MDEAEAKVVRLIFSRYLDGWGLKRIAIQLNDDRVPPPAAGRRGTGSWAPSSIRVILRNERYRGRYIHGRIKRIREGGKRIAVRVPEKEWLRVEMPEWQIIDDDTWEAAQVAMAERNRNTVAPGPAAKYALSGIARCGVCGGSIGARKTRASPNRRVPAYGCTWHHLRGNSVCPVAALQPVEEVEGILVDYLQEAILTPVLVERVVKEIRAEIDRQVAAAPVDTAQIETELADLRAQVKKLVRLGALTDDDDIPELADELRRVNARVRDLEADLKVAHRLPEQLQALMKKVEETAKAKLADLRTALAGDREATREVFRALFPEGLTFTPAPKEGKRRVFAISGMAKLDVSKLSGDPTGT